MGSRLFGRTGSFNLYTLRGFVGGHMDIVNRSSVSLRLRCRRNIVAIAAVNSDDDLRKVDLQIHASEQHQLHLVNFHTAVLR